MNQNKRYVKDQLGSLFREPSQTVGAMLLAAALGAVIMSFFGLSDRDSVAIIIVMLICAAVEALVEVIRPFKIVAVISSILLFSASGVCAVFLIIGEFELGELLVSIGENGVGIGVIPVLSALLLLALLCVAVNFINRRFSLRCVTAAACIIGMLISAWQRIGLASAPLFCLIAYCLIVLCQVFGLSRSADRDDSPRRQVWPLSLCLIAALIAVVLPAPSHRIAWEKLFPAVEMESSDAGNQLAELLDIEQLTVTSYGEGSVTGFSADSSSLGGWVELKTGKQLTVYLNGDTILNRLCGGIYDQYTGSGWESTGVVEGFGYVSPDEFTELSGCMTITVSPTDVEDDTVFYPAGTVAVSPSDLSETGRKDSRMVFTDSSAVGAYDLYYTRSLYKSALAPEELEPYLALPDDLPERVYEYVNEITVDCITERDKAYMIRDTLRQRLYTTAETDTVKGDLVDRFLFEMDGGYCTHFASTMAVLARCAGLPSRYVNGYTFDADPENGMIVLGNENAHAWTEVYFSGSGWVMFDAVPPTVIEDLPEVEEAKEKEAVNVKALLHAGGISILCVLFAIALAFALRPFVLRALRRRSLRRKFAPLGIADDMIRCERLMNTLAICGLNRADSETLIEFSQKINACEWLDDKTKQAVSAQLEYVDVLRYSGRRRKPTSRTASARLRVLAAFMKDSGLLAYLRGWWVFTP